MKSCFHHIHDALLQFLLVLTKSLQITRFYGRKSEFRNVLAIMFRCVCVLPSQGLTLAPHQLFLDFRQYYKWVNWEKTHEMFPPRWSKAAGRSACCSMNTFHWLPHCVRRRAQQCCFPVLCSETNTCETKLHSFYLNRIAYLRGEEEHLFGSTYKGDLRCYLIFPADLDFILSVFYYSSYLEFITKIK